MTIKPYPKYKDSGVDWLGQLPAVWDTDKIKFNTYVKGRVGWHGLNSDEFSDVGVHLVTGTDFDDGFVAWNRCYRISEERYNQDPYIQLKENDLLITKDGTIGKLARVKNLPEKASLNSGIFLVRAKDGTYVEDYLYWVLRSASFTHFMDLHKTGSTIQHLYQEVFNQFSFPIPSREEQNNICTFLDCEIAKIDALVAEQERLIGLLKEKRQAVISHAVTRGLNPNAPMKPSGIEWLGDVPEHWAVRKISSLSTKITNGYVGPTRGILLDEGVRYLQSLHIKKNKILFNDPYYVSKEWSDDHKKSILVMGDVLVVQTGDIGQVAVVPEEFIGCNCHALIIVSPLEHVIRGDWISWVLNSDYGFHSLLSIQTGALHPHLNCGNVKELFIPVPPKKEQQEITDFIGASLNKFDGLIHEAERGISLFTERRAALISAAVTGKIDVRDFVKNKKQEAA